MSKIYGKKATPDKGVRSYWPDWVRRLFETLKEIPWVSLTAISTLSGVLILFLYFQSIDYFPSDFAALITLGAAAAVCAIGVIVVLSLGLFAPAAVYSHYSSDEQPLGHPISITEFELVALQLGGVGALFLWIAYPIYRDCDVFSNEYGVVGFVLTGIGLVAWIRLLAPKGSAGSYFARGWAVLSLTALGLMPALIVSPLGELFTASEISFDVAFFTFWILAILANAATGNKLRVVGTVFFGAILVVLLYVAAPIATNRAGFFPTLVAKELGIRGGQSSSVLVSKRSCELLQRAQATEGKKSSMVCSTEEWSELQATVLSNVGDRWLLEVDGEKLPNGAPQKLRLAFPRNDIQVVNRVTDRRIATKPTNCRRFI
jgi:hypothetical protein